jgi:hypothetical protein
LDVTGYNFVGTICGRNSGTVSRSYATGTVTGSGNYVGGLCGSNDYGTINQCYTVGTLTGSGNYVGGLCGSNDYGTINQCYTVGALTGSGNYVGGLCGSSDFGTANGFWDTQVSGWATSASGMGRTTAEMMERSTFSSVGWSITGTGGGTADWTILREGEDYPWLAGQTIYTGDIVGLYGVDLTDYARLMLNWGKEGCPTDCQQADIDGSGVVDIGDLMILAENWLKGK